MGRFSDMIIDKNELSLAEIAAEKAALYEERLKHQATQDDTLLSTLSTEYSLLRIALVWHSWPRYDVGSLRVGMAARSPRHSQIDACQIS